MRSLRIVVFVLAFLTFGGQTLRHFYALWVEQHTSALDRFDEETDAEIRNAKTLDELTALYARLKPEADKTTEDRYSEAPPDPAHRVSMAAAFKASERLMKVREAINTWEAKDAELRALHYFWICGAVAMLLALLAQKLSAPWVALTLIIGGLLEMEFATAPAFFARAGEFEKLLDHKLAFSVASLVLLLGLWLLGPLRTTASTGDR